MQYIKRDQSVITDKSNLESLLTLKKFPVFIGATDKPLNEDVFADLSISICPETGILQLDKVLPTDLIYSGYHSEALGKVWQDHHIEFVKFISHFQSENVLEIGGSNASLAYAYLANKNANWTIVEPNPSFEPTDKVKLIKSNFDSNFVFDKPTDTIVHSHVFEHMYFPKEFLSKVESILPVGGLNLFSVPNLNYYLTNKYTNWINFEHTIYLSEYFVDMLLSQYGLKILKKYYYQNHSIFYATEKVGESINFKSVNQYTTNKALFDAWHRHVNDFVSMINTRLTSYSGSVYLFGGHVFSQMLLYSGLSDKIETILDNSDIKENKRLYGFETKIQKPSIIAGLNNTAVILNAGGYQQEIKDQLLSINPSIEIWE